MRSGRKTLTAMAVLAVGIAVALPFYRPADLPRGDLATHETSPLLLRRHVPLKLPASVRDEEAKLADELRSDRRVMPAKVRSVEIRKNGSAESPTTLAEPPSLLPRAPR